VEHWLFTQLARDGAASTLPFRGLRNGRLDRLAGWARCWVLRKRALSLGLQYRPWAVTCEGGGLWCCPFLENCTVDASI
jgi:hypothetical protein